MLCASCYKEDVDVKYSVSCDDCAVRFHAGGDKYGEAEVDTHEWIFQPDTVKVMAYYFATVTMREDEQPTLVMERDSGYAFVTVQVGPEKQGTRVYDAMQTVTFH